MRSYVLTEDAGFAYILHRNLVCMLPTTEVDQKHQ